MTNKQLFFLAAVIAIPLVIYKVTKKPEEPAHWISAVPVPYSNWPQNI